MRRRRALLLAASVLVLGALGTGVAVATDDGTVPRGTAVRGLEIGGLSRAEAVARLDGAFESERTMSISLVAGEEVLQLDPVAAGLDLDAEATVEAALDVGPLQRLAGLLGQATVVEPVPAVDDAELTAALTALASGFDREAREGSLRFDEAGEVVEELPVTGRRLDVEAAAEALVEEYLSLRVEVPVEVEEVGTTAEEVAAARREIAEPAVAAPITVEAEGGRVVVQPEDLALVLTVVAEDGELVPRVDGQALRDRLGRRLDAVGEPAVDATFDTSSGTPVVVPSRTGRSVSADDLAAAVLSVLTDDAPRTATAPLSTSEPRLTTEVAAGLGVKEVIGSYTSRHPCCAPRVTNIQRIADIVDGHVLRPGERFDLNAFVGPRDRARGFVEAPQILEGQFVDSVGGGVSQFATAVFNAVFFSGLKDVEHTPHSYWISRYPPGREATVSFPKPDLVFENDSPHGVLMRTSYTPTSVTVTFWGTKRFDEVRAVEGRRTRFTDFTTEYVQRDDCLATQGERGFDIVVTRVFVQGGREVEREDFRTRYKAEPRFVCGPPPRRSAPSPAASPAAPPPSPAPG